MKIIVTIIVIIFGFVSFVFYKLAQEPIPAVQIAIYDEEFPQELLDYLNELKMTSPLTAAHLHDVPFDIFCQGPPSTSPKYLSTTNCGYSDKIERMEKLCSAGVCNINYTREMVAEIQKQERSFYYGSLTTSDNSRRTAYALIKLIKKVANEHNVNAKISPRRGF